MPKLNFKSILSTLFEGQLFKQRITAVTAETVTVTIITTTITIIKTMTATITTKFPTTK